MNAQLRIARPVSSLEKSVDCRGLGMRELARFRDHEGFDGVMLGVPELAWHFEFTFCRFHPVRPAPTVEDLVVFYVPDLLQWQHACASMLDAGFEEVVAFNPYWQRCGRTLQDHDGYRVVLQQAEWSTP